MIKLKLAVIMDPVESIKIAKDSTFAMLLEAAKRGWEIRYLQQQDVYLRDGVTYGRWQTITVKDDPSGWVEFHQQGEGPLHLEADVLLMRKDPPFDMEYIYTTYLLEIAERDGLLVVNRPGAVRDANEKLFTAWFPQCCTPTLVSRRMEDIRSFIQEVGDAIIKPLDMMGGASIYRLRPDDVNLSVILESMTEFGHRTIMAQEFIPEISEGDKRILLVDGKPAPYALARIPKAGETRGNLAAGGRGEGVPLTERDYWICEQVGESLRQRGLLFVGLDVIGDYLTEINVTSPTCIRELDAQFGLNIAGDLMTAIEARLA